MPELRDMELLVALARHRHFGRAADACGISQPAFSARIQNFEHALGAPIVKRGNRFAGFTPEGDIALRWARQLLQDADGLKQDIEAAKGGLSGAVSLGTVPTSLTFTSRVPSVLRRVHPGLTVQIRTMSSREIVRGLEEMSLDAGITYLDGPLPKHLTTTKLYDEEYVLIAPRNMVDPSASQVTWAAAADLPLCLLSTEMRNRRIIDQVFEDLSVHPKPVVETNAFTAALIQVAEGTAATIAPALLASQLPATAGSIKLKLVDPAISQPIGLVSVRRSPEPPISAAIKAALMALK